jgi:predicted nucleic acid-binding protein
MYLLDTNILIYHLNRSIPVQSIEQVRQILKNHFNISIISKMELLGFKRHSPQSYKKSESFLENAEIIGLDDEIVDTVIQLRRNKSIKLPDAIIAATARVNQWTLVTRNENDFSGIELTILNPFAEIG